MKANKYDFFGELNNFGSVHCFVCGKQLSGKEKTLPHFAMIKTCNACAQKIGKTLLENWFNHMDTRRDDENNTIR